VFRVNPYNSWFELYLGKIPEEEGGQVKDISNKDAVKWGTRLEAIVIQAIKEDYGVPVQKDETTYWNNDYGVPLYAHLDGVSGDRGVEIKTTKVRNIHNYGEEGSDYLPKYQLMQGIHQLICCPWMSGVDFFVYYDRDELRHYQVNRDEFTERLIKAYVKEAKRFWKHVTDRKVPDAQTREDIKHLYPQSTDNFLTADSDVGELLARLQGNIEAEKQAKAALKLSEERVIQDKITLSEYIGENAGIMTEAGKSLVNFRTSESKGRFDQKRFREEEPELYEKYRSDPTVSRRLSVSWKNFEGWLPF
jgi:predicted phage-related endonuclease